jgi:hypothetical protein
MLLPVTLVSGYLLIGLKQDSHDIDRRDHADQLWR